MPLPPSQGRVSGILQFLIPHSESVFLNAGRFSFERIWLHFKAIFRRLSGAIAVAPLPKAGATSPRWNPLPKA